MVSELEARVREMDDTSRSIADVAKEIAPLVNLSLYTIRNIISTERNGYESVKDFREEWARSKKFNNYSQYARFRRAQSKKVKYIKMKTGQKKFEDSLERIEPELLDEMEYFNRNEASAMEEESKEELKKYLRVLSKREKSVLIQYFCEERTLSEIGKEYGLTKERIRQIKEEAIEKIRTKYSSFLEVA